MKFNKRASIGTKVEKHPDRIWNKEGGIAFKTDQKTELTLRLLTYLVGEPKFYTPNAETETAEIRLLIQQVAEIDPEYLMKLSVYARNQMHLRSAPLFTLVESAQYNEVKPYIREYAPQIIQRADELTETIAYFTTLHGDIGIGNASLPNSLKKGLADSFHNFDQYQFAKYNRGGIVKMRDVMRLVHPKPTTKNEELLFKQIIEDTLPTPETWETVISVNGSNKESWESVTPKMGYMAKLRNLRNFLKNDVNIEPVVSHLTNVNAVKNSKQFPFRFYSAYRELTNTSEGDPFKKQKLLSAVEQALEQSVDNLPKLKGKTFITCDESGSMESALNRYSTVQYIDIANIMGALGHRICDEALASVFAESFSTVSLNPNDTVLTNMNRMMQAGRKVGHSTNAFLAQQWLNSGNIYVDRIMIFSDMQCYSTHGSNRLFYYEPRGQSLYEQFLEYKRNINPNVKLYSFDLTGYGTVQFPQDEPNAVLIAGWSDRVLEFIHRYENFNQGFIGEIENFKLF